MRISFAQYKSEKIYYITFIFVIVGGLLIKQIETAGNNGPTGTSSNHHLHPCDRSRRVFRDSYGEISDGPAGSNYTQVWAPFLHYSRTLL